MEKKKMKIWKKLLIALGVIIALLAIAFIGYKLYDYMDKETRFKEFEKRDYVKTEGTLSYVGDNSSKVENMDYVTQDEIGVKVDSITITDLNSSISFWILPTYSSIGCLSFLSCSAVRIAPLAISIFSLNYRYFALSLKSSS